jgi:hypothetical protein
MKMKELLFVEFIFIDLVDYFEFHVVEPDSHICIPSLVSKFSSRGGGGQGVRWGQVGTEPAEGYGYPIFSRKVNTNRKLGTGVFCTLGKTSSS